MVFHFFGRRQVAHHFQAGPHPPLRAHEEGLPYFEGNIKNHNQFLRYATNIQNYATNRQMVLPPVPASLQYPSQTPVSKQLKVYKVERVSVGDFPASSAGEQFAF
jgi:hypothetical protein